MSNTLNDLFSAAQECTGEEWPYNWEYHGLLHINEACSCPKPIELSAAMDDRLYGKIVSVLQPFFPLGSHELNWDILPNTIRKLAEAWDHTAQRQRMLDTINPPPMEAYIECRQPDSRGDCCIRPLGHLGLCLG